MLINNSGMEDFDPLVDIEVTVEIQKIRYLEETTLQSAGAASTNSNFFKFLENRPIFQLIKKIFNVQETGDALFDLYVKVFINEAEFTSDTWTNTKYVDNPQTSFTVDVSDDVEDVEIRIELYRSETLGDTLCDLSPDSGSSDASHDADIAYSIKTGHWTGDDEIQDSSGYGRLCGCDDGTIYTDDYDSELWFNIYQNDFDEDGIPYWMEVNDYGSDPESPDTGDPDNDDVPVDWEWKWGYDPFSAENHDKLDPDGDSIDNEEEYLVSQWFSDPFRKDVYVEMDKMDDGPNGERVYFPVESEELIETAFNRQNMVFHLDMGTMGGYEIIPFDDYTEHGELNQIYQDYFLHNGAAAWRKGIFRYGVVVYTVKWVAGYIFRPDAYQVSSDLLEDKCDMPLCVDEIVYASGYMHELGHSFDFNPIPGHDRLSGAPWLPGWWINRPYKSCMNYGWVYTLVDYSDGSREDPDLDDWERIDWDAFERNW